MPNAKRTRNYDRDCYNCSHFLLKFIVFPPYVERGGSPVNFLAKFSIVTASISQFGTPSVSPNRVCPQYLVLRIGAVVGGGQSVQVVIGIIVPLTDGGVTQNGFNAAPCHFRNIAIKAGCGALCRILIMESLREVATGDARGPPTQHKLQIDIVCHS